MVEYGSSGRKAEFEDPDKFNALTEASWKLDLDLESSGITNKIGGIGMKEGMTPDTCHQYDNDMQCVGAVIATNPPRIPPKNFSLRSAFFWKRKE